MKSLIVIAALAAATFASQANARTTDYICAYKKGPIYMGISGRGLTPLICRAFNGGFKGQPYYGHDAGHMLCAFSFIDHPRIVVGVFSHKPEFARIFCRLFTRVESDDLVPIYP